MSIRLSTVLTILWCVSILAVAGDICLFIIVADQESRISRLEVYP